MTELERLLEHDIDAFRHADPETFYTTLMSYHMFETTARGLRSKTPYDRRRLIKAYGLRDWPSYFSELRLKSRQRNK